MYTCSISHTPLRAAAAHASEMVSMLLFGEEVTIIGEEGDYYWVENTFDQYRGYVPKAHITQREEGALAFLKNDFLPIPFRQGAVLLPKGAMLVVDAQGSFFYQGHALRLPNEARLLMPHEAVFNGAELLQSAYQFVGTPYLWGGRTRFGIDCSGFVQLLFKEQGIALKRDAKEQVVQGVAVASIQQAQLADLAFFANKAGKVTHVGVMDGKGSIIHSSGQVRVDSVDEKGIFNAELNEYTHELCAIRRLV